MRARSRVERTRAVRAAHSAPPIHDISTDVDDPPPFVAIPPLRAGAYNAAEHGGPAIAARPESERIEATDRTFWFGFRDDIVVRVRPREGGSVVDVRSVSRIGRSDTRTNAERIRRFIHELKP